MWHSAESLRPNNDVRILEACAQRAGAALACAYSSSAEYDAELIAERRAAGVYGPRRQRRFLLIGAAGVAGALLIIASLLL